MRSGARALALSAVLVQACTRAPDAEPPADSSAVPPATSAAPARTVGRIVAVQLASLADSVRAAAVADSLRREGWDAGARRATVGAAMRWRVLVAPSRNALLPEVVALALKDEGHDAITVRDSLGWPAGTGAAYRVNRWTQGMAVTVRWIVSPDGRDVLVMDDPVGVENEAVPNGIAWISDDRPIVQIDSVWHAAPSPDWRRLAYGRAYVLNARERDSLSTAEWSALARRLRLPMADVRAGAFASSGMAIAFGVAQPAIVEGATPAGATSFAATGRLLPTVVGGWRVGWTPEGRLAVGGPPAMVNDDAPSRAWMLLDPRDGKRLGDVAPTAVAPVEWVTGPTLDISIPVDASARRTLRGGTYVIEGERGWIRVRALRDSSRGRIVGPGVPLVATASGRWIVALAPRPGAKAYESKWQVTVYDVGRSP